MAIYFPPPPPMMGGGQPYAPRELTPSITAVQVDNPPTTLGGPVALKAEAAAIAQPDPWVYRIARGQPFDWAKLSPGIPGQSIDTPPAASHPGRSVAMVELAALWQPDPWVYDYGGARQPYDQRRLAPGVPGQSIDSPPIVYGGPYVLKAEILAIEQPAWTFSPWPYAFVGGRQPYEPRKATPRLISVAVDDPPFTNSGRGAQAAELIAAWTPPPPFFHVQLYASRPTPQRLRPTARGYIIL